MHIVFMIFMLAYMMSKDIINGKSFGKNRKKMHIVDINTNTPASGIKTILRNITVIIWPIEVIIEAV